VLVWFHPGETRSWSTTIFFVTRVMFLGMRWLSIRKDPDRFLKEVSGVIHVGANTGQEAPIYSALGLRVVWVEPIPEVFTTLQLNLRKHPRQAAFQCLLSDRDDAEYAFHVANNAGASSSILEMKRHKEVWPDVSYERTINMPSLALPSFIKRNSINLDDFDALVLDTQGSEYLILQGAIPILNAFRFIKTEVPDFEAYVGCCQLGEMNLFLKKYGFRQISKHRFAERAGIGSYYDVVYRNKR
jgi:FkbM family methyltransferase